MSKRKRNLKSYSSQELYSKAKSDDWKIREDVGFELRTRAEDDFVESFKVVELWITDNNENVRRAAVIGCMVRKRYGNPYKVNKILNLIENVLNDSSVYVRRNTGPFVIGYLGYTYPETVLPILKRWAQEYQNSDQFYICWNIISAFSQALGRRHPNEALHVVGKFVFHPHYIVKRAAVKSLTNIAKVAFADTVKFCHAILDEANGNEVAFKTIKSIEQLE